MFWLYIVFSMTTLFSFGLSFLFVISDRHWQWPGCGRLGVLHVSFQASAWEQSTNTRCYKRPSCLSASFFKFFKMTWQNIVRILLLQGNIYCWTTGRRKPQQQEQVPMEVGRLDSKHLSKEMDSCCKFKINPSYFPFDQISHEVYI